jgi:serine protease Do
MTGKNVFLSAGTVLTMLLLLGAGVAKAFSPGDAAAALQEQFIQVAQRTMPAVVSVRAQRTVQVGPFGLPQDFFKGTPYQDLFKSRPQVVLEQGSGIIINDRGDILTNQHVLGGSARVVVFLADGRKLQGVMVAADSKYDIGLVHVTAGGLTPAKLGDSDKIRVGQWAIAIGSPFGLEHTVTVGVISATGRSGLGEGTYGDFIQTDASINPGNSGGPLLDINGRVIGITNMMLAGGQGIGFAIPINVAKKIMASWLKRK